jgi:PDZ domain
MPRPRVPWWLFVLALSFLAFFIFATYCRFWNPEPEGFHHQFRSGHMIVLDVIPNSPAETAGLKPGDRIASVNGQILGTASDWFGFRANIEVNRPLRLGIERGGETRSALLILNKRAWNGMPTTGRLHVFAWTALQFLTLVMAFVIAYNSANRSARRPGHEDFGGASQPLSQVTSTCSLHCRSSRPFTNRYPVSVPSPSRAPITLYGEIALANQGQVVVSQQTPAHTISTQMNVGKNRDRKMR